MPVVDGVFAPRAPLALAETHVDYLAHDNEILHRRAATETYAAPTVKRLAYILATAHATPVALVNDLAGRVERSLDVTMRFGYQHAQAEIARLRHDTTARARVTDAGEHGHVAAGGLDAIRAHIRQRARAAADAVARAASAEAVKQHGVDAVLATAAITKAGIRELHSQVLDLVGETLNMGRAGGAMSLPQPPEFALRSEQLDKACCDACVSVHGTIQQVGTDEFYAYMPPAYCYGGGRCRGIYVYGDTADQMQVSIAA